MFRAANWHRDLWAPIAMRDAKRGLCVLRQLRLVEVAGSVPATPRSCRSQFARSGPFALCSDRRMTKSALPRRARGLKAQEGTRYSAGVADGSTSAGIVTGPACRRKRRQAMRMSRNNLTQAFGSAKWDANSRLISRGCQ